MRVHYDAPPKSKDKPKTVRVPEVETDDGRRTIRKGDA
jgi:hypothetical protein